MDWQRLCEQLRIGSLTDKPMRLIGGWMHTMYKIVTEDGVYAVKCLNPQVMARTEAHANFAAAERLEGVLEHTDLPILPALTIGGRKMQEVDGAFFYVFPYFDGKALQEGDITPAHCDVVGRLLAKLHAVETIPVPVSSERLTFDWSEFDLSNEDKAVLTEMQENANGATLPPRSVICHNDMDPKNVLWHGMDCRIIDLECLGYGSPYQELLETALCWAGYESGAVDWGRFAAFVKAYAGAGGDLKADWESVYHANCGRLGWLHYNLQRAEDSHAPTAALGQHEVDKTLTCIRGFRHIKETLTETMKTIQKEGLV